MRARGRGALSHSHGEKAGVPDLSRQQEKGSQSYHWAICLSLHKMSAAYMTDEMLPPMISKELL